MKKFTFSKTKDVALPVFIGSEFYDVYKEAHFLRDPNNIETILFKGHELRKMLKEVEPGAVVELHEMYLYEKGPLFVKKTGPNIEVKKYEFTTNRLSGLVAAYAFDNRLSFDSLKSSEAGSLGLKWDNTNVVSCKLFLSAVSGAEHFYDQFHFWPLICAIKKLQLKKIPIEPVIKMAKIKNSLGLQMATDFTENSAMVRMLWALFPNSSYSDLVKLILQSPPEFKKLFKYD